LHIETFPLKVDPVSAMLIMFPVVALPFLRRCGEPIRCRTMQPERD
jgi:hypothetical protein